MDVRAEGPRVLGRGERLSLVKAAVRIVLERFCLSSLCLEPCLAIKGAHSQSQVVGIVLDVAVLVREFVSLIGEFVVLVEEFVVLIGELDVLIGEWDVLIGEYAGLIGVYPYSIRQGERGATERVDTYPGGHRMSGNYYPSNDLALKDWLTNFVTTITSNAAQVGLAPADLTELTADADAFIAALDDYMLKHTALGSATGAKKQTRAEAIGSLRPLVQRIQHHPGMTDALRGMLRLPIRTTSQAVAGMMSEEVPQLLLETEPGSVTVHFGTNAGNEKLNSRPAGVQGCNIYRDKNNSGVFELVGFQKSSPFIDTIEGPASDYTYVVQYRGNRASQVGKTSAPQTIAARGGFAAQAA